MEHLLKMSVVFVVDLDQELDLIVMEMNYLLEALHSQTVWLYQIHM